MRRSMRVGSESSNRSLVGKGVFRKKGARVRNWKVRTYEIYSDATLCYFDPKNKSEKGVLDVSSVLIIPGKAANLDKSGSLDYSTEVGVTMDITFLNEAGRVMEIVFDDQNAAKAFCITLGQVCTSSNLLEYFQNMSWNSEPLRSMNIKKIEVSQANNSDAAKKLLEADSDDDSVDGVGGGVGDRHDRGNEHGEADDILHDIKNIRYTETSISLEDEDFALLYGKHDNTRKSSECIPVNGVDQAPPGCYTVLLSGHFYKEGHIRKSWKNRFYEIRSTGILVYKSEPNSYVIRGSIDLRGATIFQRQVMIPQNVVSNGSSPIMNTQLPVIALEITNEYVGRKLLIAFDIRSATQNAVLSKAFRDVVDTLSGNTSSASTPGAFINQSTSQKMLSYIIILLWLGLFFTLYFSPSYGAILFFCVVTCIMGSLSTNNSAIIPASASVITVTPPAPLAPSSIK